MITGEGQTAFRDLPFAARDAVRKCSKSQVAVIARLRRPTTTADASTSAAASITADASTPAAAADAPAAADADATADATAAAAAANEGPSLVNDAANEGPSLVNEPPALYVARYAF
jgi:hypothetical protein